MSAWHDKDRWAALLNERGCPICRNGEPDDIVAELDSSWVTMSGDPFEGQPINPRSVVSPVYLPGEFTTVRDAICRALDDGTV